MRVEQAVFFCNEIKQRASISLRAWADTTFGKRVHFVQWELSPCRYRNEAAHAALQSGSEWLVMADPDIWIDHPDNLDPWLNLTADAGSCRCNTRSTWGPGNDWHLPLCFLSTAIFRRIQFPWFQLDGHLCDCQRLARIGRSAGFRFEAAGHCGHRNANSWADDRDGS